mgnify:CR=1 FL=1
MKPIFDPSSKHIRRMNELKLQEIAHEKGEDCEVDGCESCCGDFVGHEFEDYCCINCGAETDGSDAANRAHERSEGER